MKRLAAGILLLIATLAAETSLALDERIAIPSRTLTDEQFLRGDGAAGTDITLSGHLFGGPDGRKRPIVILLHGTDGPASGAAAGWRNYLDSIGVATLRLDSYTARGLANASASQGSAGQFQQIYDSFRAADLVAADPRFDPARILIMGFSRGGTATLYAAMTRFQRVHGPRKARIAAFLPVYPTCNFKLEGELDISAVPLRVFHGSEDDWTPAGPCRDYIARVKAAGADAAMTEYPGARHGFDNIRNPAYISFPEWQTSRNCFRREENGRLINAATGAPFSYADACVEYGPSTQYNDKATTQTRAAVKSLIEQLPPGN